MFTNDPKPSDIGSSNGSKSSNRWAAAAYEKGKKTRPLTKAAKQRLSGAAFSKPRKNEAGTITLDQPISSASDPRWVMAIRTASLMEGSLLPPQNREKLIKLGKMLNLSPFDTNLIIAIIQDQARRGYKPQYCPTAGEAQLRMIPLPRTEEAAIARSRNALYIALTITAIIGIELIALWVLVP